MAKYKPYQYDQMVMIPISLQDQLEPGTLEHTIHELVEHHIDLSVFESRYQNDNTGAKAINPKLLLKVILFAYSRGIISSRQIERACGENILFMALSGGCRPDHSTLAHFISSMQKEIESIFSNILLVCDELHLLGGTHFSLDGVKLPANASKEWSGTFTELKKKRDKLQVKLQRTIIEHIHQDELSSSETKRRHQQQKRLLHQVERLNEFLQEQKPKIGKGCKEIQSNVTDNQSAKMPTSHGVIQGYNAQALVDAKNQIIVHAEASSCQDHENLALMMTGARKNMQAIGKAPDYFKGRQLTADSNYYSYADFVFDDSKQIYLCPQGNILKRSASSQRNRYRVYDIYRARQKDCASCQVRSRCLSKSDTPRRYLSVEVESQQPNLIEKMKAKIDAPLGKQIY